MCSMLNHCRITENLGAGQFGTVDKGVWLAPWGPTDSAVKKLHEGSSEVDRVKFLQEAAIMGQFFHPNIVQLYGVVTMGEPVSCHVLCEGVDGTSTWGIYCTHLMFALQVMIVYEFMSRGNLQAYLKSL